MCRLIFLLFLMITVVPYLLEGSLKCYTGPFMDTADFYKEVICNENENVCHTVDCGNGGYSRKSCGKCPADQIGFGCKCINCISDLCNAGEPIGNINECYKGRDGNHQVEKCHFFNNEFCYALKCNDGRDMKGCGKCHGNYEFIPFHLDCKCTDCTEDLCNFRDPEASKQRCFVGEDGNYKEKDCKFSNTDGCHTIECENPPKIKLDCGKCPAELPFSRLPTPPGCKCTSECTGHLCNKADFEKDENCPAILDRVLTFCLIAPFLYIIGSSPSSTGTTAGVNGNNNNGGNGGQIIDCTENSCNGVKLIGSSSFLVMMLAMIGGVITLRTIKLLVGWPLTSESD